MKTAANMIRARRKDCGMSVKEVVEKLKEYNINISVKTLYSWENGQNRVCADEFMALCNIYHIESIDELTESDDAFAITPEEETHIKKYRDLDERGKDNVDTLLESEYQYSQKSEKNYVTNKIYLVPEFLQPASAGTGDWNDDDYAENLELVKEPPKGTSYVIRVHGDSMEPTFQDSDRLFVRVQDTLEQGEIGIFVIDSFMYVKELKGHHLISHNPKYTPIALTENVRCQGKVIGICDDSYFEK